MYYYKVVNFINSFGQATWHGLNKDLNIPGSQVYPVDLQADNYCLVINQENVKNESLINLTTEEYERFKLEITSTGNQDQEGEMPLPERVAQLETGLVEMSTLAAEQEQRNIRNEQAIVELTTLVGGMPNV
ncbi:hypothetical protein [Bacillus sp. NPDC094106]|uniref:hypothetical protein n=1 Tax=Bacillus sp. NPDC094106 TaxID=3363949 RepID=UPI003803E2EA